MFTLVQPRGHVHVGDSFGGAITEPPRDKQGCNKTVCDEAEYIAAGGWPSWDLPFDWMSGRSD